MQKSYYILRFGYQFVATEVRNSVEIRHVVFLVKFWAVINAYSNEFCALLSKVAGVRRIARKRRKHTETIALIEELGELRQ